MDSSAFFHGGHKYWHNGAWPSPTSSPRCLAAGSMIGMMAPGAGRKMAVICRESDSCPGSAFFGDRHRLECVSALVPA